ncbi:MAG: tryptophan--tRNA ligase [Byssovorax sp.]
MPIRVLSGVQSSGKLHLGNYFGAIKQQIELQQQADAELFYFIADFHALTTVHDPATMRANVRDAAVDYLALGLDPKRSAFFRQSDVPEVTELAWMLSTTTGRGLLERAHSYKDKIAKGLEASMGLFYYPVLMAADILVFRANFVPVGQDQVQHIEMAQDMAQSWNHAFKTDWLVRPEPRLSSTPRVVGVDGEKMSKSYKNTIELQMEGKSLKKVVMSIKTDSTPVEDPKNPDTCNVFSLYTLFATPEERDALAARYRQGGMGYGEAKLALLEKIQTYFAPYRARRAELVANPAEVDEVLRDGATKARAVAQATMAEARKIVGLR